MRQKICKSSVEPFFTQRVVVLVMLTGAFLNTLGAPGNWDIGGPPAPTTPGRDDDLIQKCLFLNDKTAKSRNYQE